MNPPPFIHQLGNQIAKLSPNRLRIDGFRPAAVVVPLLNTQQGWELLFTVRSKKLTHHAGQVSFPGGKVDEGETLEQAAVRELHEETGLVVNRLLGQLHSHPSPAKFIVTPVVALIDWPQTLSLSPHEVDEVFTVPLKTLASITPRTERRTIEHDHRVIRFYDYRDKEIWGLTGNIVNDMLQLTSTS